MSEGAGIMNVASAQSHGVGVATPASTIRKISNIRSAATVSHDDPLILPVAIAKRFILLAASRRAKICWCSMTLALISALAV